MIKSSSNENQFRINPTIIFDNDDTQFKIDTFNDDNDDQFEINTFECDSGIKTPYFDSLIDCLAEYWEKHFDELDNVTLLNDDGDDDDDKIFDLIVAKAEEKNIHLK